VAARKKKKKKGENKKIRPAAEGLTVVHERREKSAAFVFFASPPWKKGKKGRGRKRKTQVAPFERDGGGASVRRDSKKGRGREGVITFSA